ncbi:MAG: hypothetical protein A2X12_08915 [Bacteroidetes bacterium GWE2_29_8]|nr:MAG: hypothetical protein A2X12_08915 [Bacteroidetes bacterium GWE2_29_8]OFY23325.1 MAG: hypothetical protein A2X02_08640 [Bacteroidetes bacterium GWF2_29_10]
MKYTASLDTTAKIITLLTIGLLLFVASIDVKALAVPQLETDAILIHVGKLLFFIAIILFAYLFAPMSYIVDDTKLTIVRPVGNKKINFTDIAGIRIIAESELITGIRTFGVGGLFGYFGLFNYKGIGNVTLYATQKRNRILIQTRQGQKIIITPDDLGITVQLKENLKQKH